MGFSEQMDTLFADVQRMDKRQVGFFWRGTTSGQMDLFHLSIFFCVDLVSLSGT